MTQSRAGVLFHTGIVVFTLMTSLRAADNMPWSTLPPGGLTVAQAPMFVMFGFDDNSYADGMNWFLDFIKDKRCKSGCPARASFFITSERGSTNVVAQGHQTAQDVINAWKRMKAEGHELGNHSYTHPDGEGFSQAQWVNEMTICNNFLKQNIGVSTVYGFRTPYLHHGEGTYRALKTMGFAYDCSVEWGYGCGYQGDGKPDWWWSASDPKHRGTMQVWPYTLDKGVPPECSGSYVHGNPVNPGIWEITVYTYLKPEGGEITGFDYNLFAQKKAADVFATWKYDFDLMHAGNKCPMSINTHTDNYSAWNTDAITAYTLSTVAERRKAVEDFVNYVLQFDDVIMAPMIDVIRWMRSPAPYTSYRCGASAAGAAAKRGGADGFSFDPASGRVTIAMGGVSPAASVVVTNIRGQRVFAENLSRVRGGRIGLGMRAKGVYFVKVIDGDRVRSKRVAVYR